MEVIEKAPDDLPFHLKIKIDENTEKDYIIKMSKDGQGASMVKKEY